MGLSFLKVWRNDEYCMDKSLEAKKLSEIKKLFPNLHFVKTIERDSIDADLPQADVFLLTSPSAVRYAKTNYGENFFEGKKAVCFGKKTANLLMDSGAKVERGCTLITVKTFIMSLEKTTN